MKGATCDEKIDAREQEAYGRGAGAGDGEGGAYSFSAHLSHLTIDHACPSRWGTVPTPFRDTSIIWALIKFFPYTLFRRNCLPTLSRWGCTHCHAWTVVGFLTIDPRIPVYSAGTERAGFSPTRQVSLAPRFVKRRDVFGESREGWATFYAKNRL